MTVFRRFAAYMEIFFSIRNNVVSGAPNMPNTAPRVADPRQSPFDRAMDGVKTVTVKQRTQIIEAAKKRYMAAMKKRQARR